MKRRKFLATVIVGGFVIIVNKFLKYFPEPTSPDPNKIALLVQQDYDRKADTELIKEVLKEFRYKILNVGPKEATRYNVLSKIEEMHSLNPEQAIFYYAGHGLPLKYSNGKTIFSGISVNNGNKNDFDSRAITPSTLLSHLDEIGGKKAIILDGCATGDFVDYVVNGCPTIISNYVLITACPADFDSIIHPYDGKRYNSALTWGIANAIKKSGRPVDLSKLEILCGDATQRNEPAKFEETLRKLGKYSGDGISFEMQRVSDTNFIL